MLKRLKRFLLNAAATITAAFVAIFVREISVAKDAAEVEKRWYYYNSNHANEDFNFGPNYDDEKTPPNPNPVFLRKTRNDHIVVGHTMRPQTASLATTVYSRQKVC
jgi:hypothetical protein